MNPFQISATSILTIWLAIIPFALFWRAISARLAASDNPRFSALGGAMGSTL